MELVGQLALERERGRVSPPTASGDVTCSMLNAHCSMLMPLPKHPKPPAEDGKRLAGPADQDISALGGMGELGMGELSTFMPGPPIL